jgi:hypothetical protein
MFESFPDARLAIQLPGPGTQRGSSVALGADDSVALVGDFYESVDLGQGAVPVVGGADGLVAVYQPDGDLLWSRVYGSDGTDMALEVRVHPDGGYLVSGVVSGVVDVGGESTPGLGGQDGFVCHYRADGTLAWLTPLAGPADDRAASLAVGSHIFVAGSFGDTMDLGTVSLTATGTQDAFVAALDPDNGAVLWADRYAGPGEVTVVTNSLALDPHTGEIALIARFRGHLSLLDSETDSQGQHDAFLLHILPPL